MPSKFKFREALIIREIRMTQCWNVIDSNMPVIRNFAVDGKIFCNTKTCPNAIQFIVTTVKIGEIDRQ